MDPDLPQELERLAFKYRTLADLRARREEAEVQGLAAFEAEEGSQRRALFRSIAGEFPGALRELDVTPAASLRWKALSLELALQDLRSGGSLSPADRWMIWTADYHRLLREALITKRWLAHRPLPREGIDDATVAAFSRRRLPTSIHQDKGNELALKKLLEDHLHPPRGRIQALVWKRLEERHHTPGREIERILFGSHG